jgi:hypothetical protein
MSLGKRLINTGGVAACTTDSADPFGDGYGVALYSLDYDASDESGNYDGTPTDVDFGVGGKINYGARFNGSSSRIVTGVTPATGSGQFSVSGWVNVDSLSAIRGVFSTITTTGTDRKGFSVHVLTSGIVRVLVYDSAGVGVIESTDLITVGNWHHIAITYNNGLTKLYVDSGVQTDTVNQLITGYHDSINIGRYYASSASLTMLGKIDQVRIFNRALLTDNNGVNEIATLYAETACIHTSTTDIVNYPTGTTPVAYYKLDNSSEDFSTGGNDGTDTNIEYRFGRFGQAAVFNGSSSIIKDVLGSGFTYATKTMTFSAWIFVTDNSNDNVIIADGFTNTTGGWAISTGYGSAPNQKLAFSRSGSVGGVQQTYSSITIPDDTWTHIAVSVDFPNMTTNSSIKMYINGAEDTSLTDGIGYAFQENSTYNTSIGGSWSGSAARLFEGSIDQVRIYDTALTSDQVAELYNEKPETDTSNFKAVLYEGTGASQFISNVGMDLETSGGLVWLKGRDSGRDHRLFDSVRGATKGLYSDLPNAEFTESGLDSFEANGFFLGSSAGINANNESFVAWNWKAGGDAVAGTGSGVTNVSISANTDAGFSIVKYTGSGTSGMNFAHGLNSPPELVIIKNLDNPTNWQVFGGSLFTRMQLDQAGDDDGNLGLTITSTTIQTTQTSGFEGNSAWNATDDYIAYIWHSVAGYSKIGTYEGLGTSTVTVSDVGFKPSFIMIKNIDATANWNMYDLRRSTVADRANGLLYPNLANAELSGSSIYYFDMNDSGFVVSASNHEQHNKAGRTYIYMAFK